MLIYTDNMHTNRQCFRVNYVYMFTLCQCLLALILTEGRYIPMARHSSWSVERKIESLAEMDRTLLRMHIASYDTIWQEWGGGMKATPAETETNWRRIAENDDLYDDVLFCFMVCVLEPLTLEKFGMKNLKAIRKAIDGK